jgi:hypothetical protein
MFRNKTVNMLALENKKTTIMVFLVKLRALVSSWQKETKLNSYKIFNLILKFSGTFYR